MNLCVILALCVTFSDNPESFIRGVYMNPYQAANKGYLEKIFIKADSGLINAIVVDFKSDYGFLSYASELALAKEINAIKRYIDVEYLIENAELHDLKLIARIVCFRDNYLAFHKNYGMRDDSGNVWCDNKGLAWTNPYSKQVRKYLLEVTKDVVRRGITSIAFDYIRFPTDGDVERIRLTEVKGPRYGAICEFLRMVKDEIGDEAEIGVCVFGFSVWHRMKREGQDINKMAEHIDILYPMLYPSHFGRSFKRWESEYWRNYWIYFDSVKEAGTKLPPHVKVIPFVQGFDFLAENFNSDYVFAQIHGAAAARADGFLIWHAGGDYSLSWSAFSWARNLILKQSIQRKLHDRMREEGRRYQGKSSEEILIEEKVLEGGEPIRVIIDSLPSSKSPRIFFQPMVQ
jgi:hypothetical protein